MNSDIITIECDKIEEIDMPGRQDLEIKRELVWLERANNLLMRVQSADEAKSLMDLASAAEHYAKKAKLSEETVHNAHRIKIEASALLGEYTGKLRLMRGKRIDRKHSIIGKPSSKKELLVNHKITRKQAAEGEFLARMKKDDPNRFQRIVNGEITLKQVRIERKREKSRSNKEAHLVRQFQGIEIRTGDFRDVLKDIPDGSVSLILTDPPYSKEFLPLWDDLGKFAKEKLAPDGWLLSYAPHLYLPEILSMLCLHLKYRWTLCVQHAGRCELCIYGKLKVIPRWKPLLLFNKGAGDVPPFQDMIPGTLPDKKMHNWSQGVDEARLLIRTFCPKDGLVLDPFAGSGGFGQAAKLEGYSFCGVEIIPLSEEKKAA
jgi:16S rRNA G966 N2-methylase RsmD